MKDSTADLNFSDFNGGKVVGMHDYAPGGNGLLNKSAKEIVIPRKFESVSVIEIGYCSFQGTGITAIFIPNSILTIRYGAFLSCKSLRFITFEESSGLKTIEEAVFQNCNSLESINIPSSVTSIMTNNYWQFYKCKSLACISYLGDFDCSSNRMIESPNLSLIVHTKPTYRFTFGTGTTMKKDGTQCPISFPIPHLAKTKSNQKIYYTSVQYSLSYFLFTLSSSMKNQ